MTNAPATITISDSTCHRLNCCVFVSTFVAAAAVAVSVPPSSSHQEPVSPSPPSPSSFRRRPLAAVSVVVVSTAAVKDPPGPSSPSPMLMAQQFNCLVTNEPTRTYLGFPGWIPLATTYEMEAGERATFYLDYDRDEVMVYYRLTGSDDDAPLTPDYVPDSTLRNVE
ncbi:hypothetical protein ZWY2020_028176 [Hordeum vulgare]|nr:hypothetical protein ZWY2020_028176 [Hordeum vulgare]